MKVFATIATLLGASASAEPMLQNQLHNSNNVMKPSMDVSGQMSSRRLDMSPLVGNRRNTYSDHQQATGFWPGTFTGGIFGLRPSQYFKEDDVGNFVYAYDDQFTQKREEGNGRGDVKGHYAYTMPNGVRRRVAYVADNNGFRVRDNADPARIKRSVDPELIQARLTSVMDSSSLNDAGYTMSNMMGRDMSSNMIGMLDRYSNMMSQNSMDRNLMGPDNMGRNIYNVNRGMNQDNTMSRDMLNAPMMRRNMMGQDMTSQVMGRNVMGYQNMTPNMMYRNLIGRNMDMSNNRRLSVNNGPTGQRMMQKMELEQRPETYTSTRFF